MKILIFCSKDNDFKVTNLISSIETRLLSDKLEFCTDIPALQIKMTSLGQRPNVVVLIASNLEELNQLVEMKDLFFDVPVIVIIPDDNKFSINLGHKLRPRFLTTTDNDISILSAILEKMKKRS